MKENSTNNWEGMTKNMPTTGRERNRTYLDENMATKKHNHVLADHRIKLIECEKKENNLDLSRETMEHESDDCTDCDWCFWHSDRKIIKGLGGFGSWRTSRDHPNDSIIEDGQNTETSPGDLRRLSVTETPVKNIS